MHYVILSRLITNPTTPHFLTTECTENAKPNHHPLILGVSENAKEEVELV